jgi:glycosyltransferase involved in cell wall biosynthesis
MYIHQYFVTRKGFTGTRSYDVSRYLVNRGHDVTMITSGIGSNEFQLGRNQPYAELNIEGIRVIPIAAGFNNSVLGTGMGGWQRIYKFYEFARLAKVVGKKLGRPDVVYATHTPLTVGLVGISLSHHFDVPFVFEVRDVWPDALINIGALKNPLAIWWLRRMAKKIYSHAKHIVALSPGIKECIIRAGVPPDKISIIPNGTDTTLFRPNLDGSDWRKKLGLSDRFAAVYFGAMGLANGLDYVIEAARVLAQRGHDKIVFVLHGGGKQKPVLKQMVRDYNLSNVVFNDMIPDKNEVAKLVAACNVCLTVYRASKEHAWSPNKLFDSLAAGKPVLINVPGWLGQVVERNGCGRLVDPLNPETLAEALEELAANPNLCQELGRNARTLAVKEYDRNKLARQIMSILLQQ